jgi:hypothetical protein
MLNRRGRMDDIEGYIAYDILCEPELGFLPKGTRARRLPHEVEHEAGWVCVEVWPEHGRQWGYIPASAFRASSPDWATNES